MPIRSRLPVCALTVLLCAGLPGAHAQDARPPLAPLAGTWVGEATHDGGHTTVALTFTPTAEGGLGVRLFLPVVHVGDIPLGSVSRDGDSVRAGPFAFTFDSVAGVLTGVLPSALVPVHRIPVRLRRGSLPTFPTRPDSATTSAPSPAWTLDAGSPIWTDPVIVGDLVLIGTDDGRLHARDVGTGAARWEFRADGPIRAPVAVAGNALYVHADDGFLHRLDATTGAELWKVRTTEAPIVRTLPPTPNARWDTRASAVAVGDGRLFVGTHDGQVLALDTADGTRRWAFPTGGSILSTPAMAAGRVFVGSYDGMVYALDAASGTLLWTYDTGAPVTSTPVPWGDVVVAGSRSYDLFGLDAATGTEIWNRYVWFSWIESTPAIRDGIAYVGSSDAGKVMAIEVASGRSVWDADVLGASWGTPAVTDHVLYVGTRGQAGAFTHAAGVLALDRASGRLLWRFRLPAPDDTPFSGVAGSPALGHGRVFVATVDGHVYAFDAHSTR